MPGATNVVWLVVLHLELFAEVNFQLPVILDTVSSVQMAPVVLRAGCRVIPGLQGWNLHREAQRKPPTEKRSGAMLA